MKRDSSPVTVLVNEDLGGERFRLGVAASEIHRSFLPGQFFNLAFPDGGPYLPRPFSVYELHDGSDRLDLLIAAVGSGTKRLQRVQPGDELLLIGPLGQGFPIEPESPAHVFVAGSIGLAPFVELHKTLRRKGDTSPHYLIYGARSAAELVDLEFLDQFDWEVIGCTDDGSAGFAGRVTGPLGELSVPAGALYYTCGPTPMMRAVAEALPNERVYVSMEEHMACGIGICKGCVLYHEGSPPPNPTVCKDGPVFMASEVFV